MNQKFFIVLSVAIFYNGVIYASPVNNLEGALPEEKPPVSPVTVDHKKIEPAHIPTTPITQKPSVPLHQSEIPTTALPDAISQKATVAPHIIEPKNVTHDSVSKNATSVINQKNSTLVTDGKNASQPIDNKSVIPVNGPNGTVPAGVPAGVPSVVPSVVPSGVPTGVPAGVPSSVSTSTLAPTASPAVVPEKPTTVSITTTTLNTTIATTTITPNSTTSDKVVVVHNVVTPVQEKHFDGPSFIGGIVLTIGLTAIGFIAFKYYKAGKIDMNYRTL